MERNGYMDDEARLNKGKREPSKFIKGYGTVVGIIMANIINLIYINKTFRAAVRREWFAMVRMVENQNKWVIAHFMEMAVGLGESWDERGEMYKEALRWKLPHPFEVIHKRFVKDLAFKALVGVSGDKIDGVIFIPKMGMVPGARFDGSPEMALLTCTEGLLNHINLPRTLLSILCCCYNTQCGMCGASCKSVQPTWGNTNGARICRACMRGEVLEISTIHMR